MPKHSKSHGLFRFPYGQAGSDVDDERESLSDSSVGQQIDQDSLTEEIEKYIDELGDTSPHPGTLLSLVQLLSHHYCGNLLETNRSETLLRLLIRLLRKPGSFHESLLAVRSIALVFLNQGDISKAQQDVLYALVAPPLKAVILEGNRAELKHQSMTTLAMVSLIAASDADTRQNLGFFYRIFLTDGAPLQPEDPSESEILTTGQIQILVESSLRSYGLLYASLYGDGRGTWDDARDELRGVMTIHLDLMESRSMDIRKAAAENIGLMLESTSILLKIDQSAETKELEDEEDFVDTGRMTAILNQLAAHGNRKHKKHESKDQRNVFRLVLQTAEHGLVPEKKVKLGKRSFVFKGWAHILEFDAFFDLLGQGLIQHIHANEIVQAVFGADLAETVID
ncbi:interferon-related developmental regulator-domain-containing protein [Phycomyces nitens]|nr:interferon-related developmental regulator-domain-containing protein [Phycomyces nitens]